MSDEKNRPSRGLGPSSKKSLVPRKKIQWSKLIGKGFIGLGILSILDFFSPIPIPTTFAAAFLSGGFMIALGLFLVYKDRINWEKAAAAAAKPLAAPAQPSPPPVKIDPLLPVKILKLAKKHDGILTASIVAMELDVPLDQVEAGLNECIRFGQAMADFDMRKEITIYVFNEQRERNPEADAE